MLYFNITILFYIRLPPPLPLCTSCLNVRSVLITANVILLKRMTMLSEYAGKRAMKIKTKLMLRF